MDGSVRDQGAPRSGGAREAASAMTPAALTGRNAKAARREASIRYPVVGGCARVLYVGHAPHGEQVRRTLGGKRVAGREWCQARDAELLAGPVRAFGPRHAKLSHR
jgi:hypothetical protein